MGVLQNIYNDYEIGVAILVGGKSSRMGSLKELLITKEGNCSFIEQITSKMNFFGEKLLSCNSANLYHFNGFKNVVDKHDAIGPMGGIYSCLLECKSEALLFVPCDMPYFEAKDALELIHEYNGEDVIVYNVLGNLNPLCGIYNKKCILTIGQMIDCGNYRIRDMYKNLNVREIYTENELPFKNINNRQEYIEYMSSSRLS